MGVIIPTYCGGVELNNHPNKPRHGGKGSNKGQRRRDNLTEQWWLANRWWLGLGHDGFVARLLLENQICMKNRLEKPRDPLERYWYISVMFGPPPSQ